MGWHWETPYVSEKEGRREPTCIEDCVDATIQGVKKYTPKIKKKKKLKKTDTTSISRNSRMINGKITIKRSRKPKYEGKLLHGYLKWKTLEIALEMTWTWINRGTLKREKSNIF